MYPENFSAEWPCRLSISSLRIRAASDFRVLKTRVWPAVVDVSVYRFINASHHFVGDDCAGHNICAAAFCVNKPQPRLSRKVVPVWFHGFPHSSGICVR